jgi:rhamnogalacturonyl hydrolase YesR
VDGNTATRWSASFPDNFSESSPNWWWIDAMYMAAPIYAHLDRLEAQGALAGQQGYSSILYAKYDETKRQRGLYDATAGLWLRDSRFLTIRSPNDKPIFWSRGNGWVFAAHARLLEILPGEDSHYAEYLSTFRAMADALLDQQDAAGYWNENLADPDHCGGPESSGTAFFVYGLVWGINHGVLDRATILPAALKAWQWLNETAVQSSPNGLLGYVQRVGDQPECSAANPLPGALDTSDFGVGAFLLAASEMFKLASDDATRSTLHLPLIAGH